MTTARSAVEILERDFLELRHRILDVAAALDRIDRGRDAAAVTDDPRMIQLRAALTLLSDRQTDRVERVQMTFSRAYDPDWRK